MEVTPIGWLLLVIGPLLMLFRPKWLYVVTIFSLPFTATDIVNVGNGDTYSGVQTPMFFGALLILRYGFSFLTKMSLPLPRKGTASLVCLGIFIAIATLSLIMPIWLDSQVLIPSSSILVTTTTLLHFKSKNITGLLYMILGYSFVYLIAVANQKADVLRLTVKAFIAGSAFAAAWGLVEFVCKIADVPYPAMIFNTGLAANTTGYMQRIRGFPRIASVAVEPSVFAQTMVIAVCLYLPFVFGRLRLFGKAWDRRLFALLFGVLCLSTSSTGYVGIAVGAFTVFALFTARGVLTLQHFKIPLIALAVSALIDRTVTPVRIVLHSALFAKAQDYSALERFMTVHNAYQMFFQHPWLGIGWASMDSFDLIANISANAGIFGLLSFTVAMYFMFRVLYRSIRSRSRALGAMGLMQMDFGVYVALAAILGTQVVGGFLYVFLFFWFVPGLAIAAASSTETFMADTPDRDMLPLKLESASGA
ncbi:MAG: O-antigen ligase family protein [Acidobacteriaceae bacterium]|nr:O-antigen ligase family protein [Acidobacteriaceae bacterium]